VLNNLMSNAVKFTDRGEVVLSAKVIPEEAAGVVLHIEVTDTGMGIDEKEHPKLFRSFAQLENPECRAHAGAGLGLAICKQIVAGGGGYIDYHSTPGVGSSFWIVMRFGKAEHELPLVPADPVVAGRKVLVIAKSQAVRRMVRDHCRSLEMRTWIAEDEVRATELVRAAGTTGTPFELVVADAQSANPAFIALAGASGATLILLTPPPRHGKEETWPDGVDAILNKPVREAQFVHTVKTLLTSSKKQPFALH
jgi:two-component system sensor histidine kinase/response regulator